MKMNARLRAYLRSLGLAEDSTDENAWEFFRSLRGLNATIANCLNYNEHDQQARSACDVALRANGVNPEDPNQMLENETDANGRQVVATAGSDGASAAGDLEQARQEGQQAEQQRRSQIEQLATMAGCSDEMMRSLIDGNIDLETARERIWNDHQQRATANVPSDVPAGGSGAPAVHSRNSVTGYSVETVEAALLHARHLDPTHLWSSDESGCVWQRTMTPEVERAIEEGHQYRRASLEDIIRMCARLDGVDLPFGRTGILQAYLRNASSTAALSAVFTTNVNSELMQAFEVAPDSTTAGFVRESDVADFRSNERVRMSNGGALQKLPRGGTAEHATYEDLVETFKIARYANQFVLDDQDIQDDNFGGLTGFVPADLGVAARQVRPDLVYSILMGNPNMRDSVALFHANHGNLNTSAALAEATLRDGRSAMRIQQENGRNLNVMAKYVIVPPKLEDTADVLIKSRLLITGENATKPADNTNAGKGLEVVSDARLENGVTDPTDGTGATVHSGSDSTWFLSGTANNHTIEVAYLRGTGRAPQIRPFVLTQGRWGLGWDVKLDIGAKALDWRGMQKNTA